MVLKSVHMRLRTEEVPIRFLKDREGRLSHHKRSGWFSPWQAAWINLRAMFVYGANFFLFKPGLLLLALGPAADAAAVVRAGHASAPSRFSLHWMLLGVCRWRCSGCSACTWASCRRCSSTIRARRPRSGSGAFRTRAPSRCRRCCSPWASRSAARSPRSTSRNGFRLLEGQPINHLGIVGLLFGISGFMTFTFTLLLHAIPVAVRRKR